jgi:hypothetical protein
LPFPAAALYGALASPQQLAGGVVGPKSPSNTFEVFEFTEGSRWQFVMHRPDATDHAMHETTR